MTSSPFQTIIEQHAEQVAFLWLLRSHAVHAPNYDLDDLAELEQRIDGHIKGLKVSGENAWEICAKALEDGDAGEVFAASVLAIDGVKKERLRAILDTADAAPEEARGMISALGWHSFPTVKPIADQLLSAESPTHRRIGLAAYAVHRNDPGRALDDALNDTEPVLRARALKAAGELRSNGRLKFIEARLSDGNQRCAFWAAWAATVLGSDIGLSSLVTLAKSDSPFAERALRLAPRYLPTRSALNLVEQLGCEQKTLRGAIIAAGAAGAPEKIPWLIEQMRKETHTRVAGEAFSMITGLDLAAENMDGSKPEGFEAGPTENPEDDNVSMDADEDLPWPKMAAIADWWQRNLTRYSKDTRYLFGKTIEDKNLTDILKSGFQRARAAAAFELAKKQPCWPPFETRAQAAVQRQLLESA